jgi:hypothetical protein
VSRHFLAYCASLSVCLLVQPAKAETVRVKDPTLMQLRASLSHYDLSPDGTLRSIRQLAEFSREHPASNGSDEADFLRAAVASDLLFIADFTKDAELHAKLASAFGTANDGLQRGVAELLAQSARGVYKPSADAALAALSGKPNREVPGVHNVRWDAALLQRAVAREPGAALGDAFAALGQDPCENAEHCPATYLGLALRGRRALSFMYEVAAALQRLDEATRLGDPLAEALSQPLTAARETLATLQLRLAAKLPSDTSLVQTPQGDPEPVPALVLIVDQNEVRYARTRLVRFGVDHKVESIAEPGPLLPQTEHALGARELNAGDHILDARVQSILALTGSKAAPSAAVAAISGVPALLVGRLLAALSHAGVARPLLMGRAEDDSMLGVPVHVFVADADGQGPRTDVKVRVRLSGYSLQHGGTFLNLPKLKTEHGYHFDGEGLRAALANGMGGSAAVSYITDVAAENVLLAVSRVQSGRAPVELIVP